MKKNRVRKGVIVVFIVLFFGVSLASGILGNIEITDPLVFTEEKISGKESEKNNNNILVNAGKELLMDNDYMKKCYTTSESFKPCWDSSTPLIINHTSISEFDQIPTYWIDQAKSNLHIAYQHTSHGSQLVTGMNALEIFPSYGNMYEWSDDGSSGLDLDDYGIPGCADLSEGDWIDEYGVTPWVTATRNLLDDPANSHVNVIMWSWCSINGHNITRYLLNMEILVAEYPEIDFIFMTGHAQGQGEGGFIHAANEQIRQHCHDYNRILFDFADIENYDPDEVYYYDRPMWDDLGYNLGATNNWGEEWIDNNTGSELGQLTTGINVTGYIGCGSCAHSNGPDNKARINCVLKGIGVWWMMARLAGWSNNSPPNVSNPCPEDDATNVSIDAILSWTGSDPDPGDNVTYDVYFGNNSPPPQVMSNQTQPFYNPGVFLDYNTQYYWKIVAWDDSNASNESLIWRFTTMGIPPEISDVAITHSEPKDTSPPGEPEGFIGGWENFTCTVTDSDGVDEVKLALVGDTTTEYLMTKDGDDYYCNITIETADEYTYHIWANDTSDNYAESSSNTFDLPLNEDVNEDRSVGFLDIMMVAGMWGATGSQGWIRADVDNNGDVGFLDVMMVVGMWGQQW